MKQFSSFLVSILEKCKQHVTVTQRHFMLILYLLVIVPKIAVENTCEVVYTFHHFGKQFWE